MTKIKKCDIMSLGINSFLCALYAVKVNFIDFVYNIKGRIILKNINLTATAVIALLAAQTVTASAATVAVNSETANVAYTYSSDSETVFDIKKIFSGLVNDSADNTYKETVEITNSADNGEITDLALRIDAAASGEAVDCYDIVVTDENGGILYDSSKETAENDGNRDIKLGRFNENGSEDTKKYTIEYKLSGDGEQADFEVSLVANKAEVKAAAAAPTQRPKFELPARTEQPAEISETFAEKNEVNKPEENKAEEKNAEEPTAKEKKYVCGKDITPGRYTVTGNGIVEVAAASGEKKKEITLNDGTIENVQGEKSGVITLSDGDVVTLYPLEGQEKASVSVEKINASGGKESERPNENAKPAEKINPKTGEKSSVLVIAVMGAAIAGVVIVEVLKRRKAE